MLEEVPKSIRLWSRLHTLCIFGSVVPLPNVPEKFRNRSGADIEKIPDCIKDLPRLRGLYIGGCPKLASLPELPASLITLTANTCESLEAISFPLDSQVEILFFPNCFKLGGEAQRVITQQSLAACLPGREIPPEFDRRAKGNSLTTRSDFYGFRFCVVVSPKQEMEESYAELLCHICLNGCHIDKNIVRRIYKIQREHLLIFYSELPDRDGWLELENEIRFEFSITSQDMDIIECGVQILTEKTNRSISRFGRLELRLEQFDGNHDF